MWRECEVEAAVPVSNLLYIHSDELWLRSQSIGPIKKNNEKEAKHSAPSKTPISVDALQSLFNRWKDPAPEIFAATERNVSTPLIEIQPVCSSGFVMADYTSLD